MFINHIAINGLFKNINIMIVVQITKDVLIVDVLSFTLRTNSSQID